MTASSSMISVEEALSRILAAVSPLGAEQAMLVEARGRVLAEEVVSARALPPWDNSAMDGYAVRAAEVKIGEALPVAFTVGAGHAAEALPPNSAARIMTGAPVPSGADAIIMREDATEESGLVRFSRLPQPAHHIRRAGEDVTKGQAVLGRGVKIGPGEIGLLAAIGRTVVALHRRPRVAIVSTGDELVEPDRAPWDLTRETAKIVGSNAWALAAQCLEAGALPTVLPIARDDRAIIRAAFEEAFGADLVISSGGVSVGEFDFVKDALSDLGVSQSFWRVAMKPGKPVAFGTRGGKAVFGLPGNPASSMVGFELFVRPALLRLQGFSDESTGRPRASVILDEPVRSDGGRRHYLRARVRRDGEMLRARPNPRQGSGMLRSMVGTNALLEVAEGVTSLDAGAAVTALLLEAI